MKAPLQIKNCHQNPKKRCAVSSPWLMLISDAGLCTLPAMS